MAKGEAERRTITELHTLYQLEPSIHDVFTEGRVDAGLVKWYLGEVGLPRPKVYAVDDRVHVPGALLQKVEGAETGARGRVMALARAASEWGEAESCLTCLIDCDRDCFATDAFKTSSLLRTDVGSLDVYAFQERPLRKLIEVVLRKSVDASGLIAELTPALNQIFCIRAALHELQVPLVPGFTSCVSTNQQSTSVDSVELARRSLATEGLVDSLGAVVDRVDELMANLPSEPRTAIRGHDIAPLLIKRLKLRNDYAKAEVLETCMRTTLTVEDLNNFSMFRTLRERVGLPM